GFGILKTNAQKLTDTAYINSKTIDKKIKRMGFKIEFASSYNYLFKFKKADDFAFKEKDFNDSGWIKRLPIFNDSLLKAGYVGKGIAWFRLRLKADTSMVDEILALNFSETGGAMEIYLDGRLIRKIGNFRKEGEAKYLTLIKQPVFLKIEDTLTHLLAIRYEYDD